MCEKKAISSDFENGQAPTSVRLWQELFAKDGDGALSVCRKQLEALPDAADARALLEKQRALIRKGFGQISQGVDTAMGRIPRAQGFFTSASDRAAAYRAACGFLELLKRELASFDGRFLEFSSLHSLLRERETAIVRAEASVTSLQKVARRSDDRIALDRVEELAELLSKYKEEDLSILNRAKVLEHSLEGFCAHTCREFCRFATVKADLEHDGAGASPAELSRLLWGLREETERLLKEI